MGMANLIDRDSLMAQLEDRQAFLVKEWGYRYHYTRGFEEAVDKVGNAPNVDSVKVVRCKDCKHRGIETCCPMCFEEWYEIDEGYGRYDSDITTHDRTIDEGFCDRGERKDNG